MSLQLRSDIDRALGAACERVKAHQVGAPGLVDDVMRLVDGTLRFLEQDQDIWNARRTVLERIEHAALLLDQETDWDGPVDGEGRSRRTVQTARAHAVDSISRLQELIIARGRINAAGDRVGLGKAGSLLR